MSFGWRWLDVDPFGGLRDGRRTRQRRHESGLAAAMYAAEALRRAVSSLPSLEVSGTVDEESGGFSGLFLAQTGAIRLRAPTTSLFPSRSARIASASDIAVFTGSKLPPTDASPMAACRIRAERSTRWAFLEKICNWGHR
jgi:hypothetical protein